MLESLEKIPSGREQLMDLESEDKYVFHGSENPSIDSLEPRQAYNTKDGVREKDGDPAIFASSRADYAILMALINDKNCPKGFHSSAGSKQKGNKEIELRLKANKGAIDQLDENSEGYVYVFDKDVFKLRDSGGVEYTSNTAVSSANKVRVTKQDLPPYIEVTE